VASPRIGVYHKGTKIEIAYKKRGGLYIGVEKMKEKVSLASLHGMKFTMTALPFRLFFINLHFHESNLVN